MIALHPTGCKLSSFLLHLLSFALQKKTKKSFQRKKIFGQERFFWRKIVNFLFLTLGKTWVRERPNILRWVRRWRLRPRKHDPSEWELATVVPPPRADNCKVRRTEERESEASPEQTTSEDRAGENQFHSWLHYWFIIIGCIIVLIKKVFFSYILIFLPIMSRRSKYQVFLWLSTKKYLLCCVEKSIMVRKEHYCLTITIFDVFSHIVCTFSPCTLLIRKISLQCHWLL